MHEVKLENMFILSFPINLTRGGQSQPKGRMWPGGR